MWVNDATPGPLHSVEYENHIRIVNAKGVQLARTDRSWPMTDIEERANGVLFAGSQGLFAALARIYTIFHTDSGWDGLGGRGDEIATIIADALRAAGGREE